MRLLCFVLVVGCGRVGFDPTGDGGCDGEVGDAGMTGVFGEIALPAGGEAIALAAQPGVTAVRAVYVSYAGGRVFRGDVSAAAWSECAPLPGAAWDLAVRADGTVAALSGTALAISTDLCASFAIYPAPIAPNQIAMTPDEVLAATNDGVWSWTPSSGWARVASPFDGVNLRDIAYDGRVAVAADNGAGIRSAAPTFTWTTMATAQRGYGVAFDPTNPMRVLLVGEDGLQHTLDGGGNWTVVRTGFHSLVTIDPANPQRVIVENGDELIQSLDGGASFGNDTITPAMANAWPNAVLFDPGGSGGAFVATGHGLFHAPDTTLAWAPADSTIRAWDIRGVAEIGTLRYVATTGGLWISESGGAWKISATNVAQSSVAHSIAVSATDPNRIYLAGDSLIRSSNRGVDFTVLLPSAQLDGWGFNCVVEAGGRVWAGSFARATYSDNDGMTWMAGNLNQYVHEIAVRANTSGQQVVAATSNGIFWSLDGGATYVVSNGGLTWLGTFAVAELADGRVVIGTEDGLWTSSARGATWTRIGFAGQEAHDLLVIGDQLFAATKSGVFVTVNAGTTWSEVDGLAAHWPRVLSLGMNNTLLVGTQGHGLYRTPLP